MKLNRRSLMLGAAAGALAAPHVRVRPALAAEFNLKLANNQPLTHPSNIRVQEAIDRIREQSDGRIEITVFPQSQLGADTDVLSQLRSGGVDFFMLSPLILSTFVPNASLNGIGFAFKDYPAVWAAMDGELGAYVRGEIEGKGLYAFEKIYDNGFRQISTSTGPIESPADLENFKIRVPVSPLWTSMFTAFGSAPTSINFSEVYTALQTGVVDGQENPLAILSNFKLWEVQKYVSMTNHMWDGFWMLANRRSWGGDPGRPEGGRCDQLQRLRRRAARRHRGAERVAAGRARGERDGLQRPRYGALPADAPRRRLLCRVEGQVRRRRLGDPRGRHRAVARLIAHGGRDMTQHTVLGEGEPVTGTQSVERALMLLSLVGRGGCDGVALAALVAGGGLNKPTTRRLLMALMRARLIEQDPATAALPARPGSLRARHARRAARHGLLEQAADSLRRLSGATGDTSFVSARHGDHVLCLHREEGSHPVRTHALQTGDQNPLGVGAGSLALLAALPEAERDAVILRLADAYAALPGYSVEIVCADVAQALEAGYALNPGRVVASSWGVGVPLRFPDGRVAGALSMAAIDSRMQPARQQELAALLHAEARAVEARIARLFGPIGPAT